jgi:hypothetical protein
MQTAHDANCLEALATELRDGARLLRAQAARCDPCGNRFWYESATWREIADRSWRDYLALEQEHYAGA